MLKAYGIAKNGPVRLDFGPDGIPAETVWIDLAQPEREEDRAAEAFLGLSIPTLEEAQEIEFSSRFYQEDGGIYMTATVTAGIDEGKPELTPMTFVLGGGRLATIRYRDFRAIGQFMARAGKPGSMCTDAPGIFLGLLEAIIDRLADVVERCGAEVDRTNQEVFVRRAASRRRAGKLESLISEVGAQGDLVGKVRECLSSLERLLQYANAVASDVLGGNKNKNRLKLMQRDVRSLADQITFLNAKITFLLEATLGLISVQQNEVIRVLTVVATFFFPPTLIGTIYGMNFHNMPELDWWLGYPMALLIMVISVLVPFYYFRRRGWM